MQRRQFIQKSCGVCLMATVATLAPGFIFDAAAKKKSKTYKAICNQNNEVIIPLQLFETTNLQIVSVKGWDYDMAVHQKEDQTFAVFLLKCTHMDNQLQIGPEGFVCTMHGSTYTKDGQVSKGPAEQALIQYQAHVVEEQIIITP